MEAGGEGGASVQQWGDSRERTGDSQDMTTTCETEVREIYKASALRTLSQVQSHPTLQPGSLGEEQHRKVKRWGARRLSPSRK